MRRPFRLAIVLGIVLSVWAPPGVTLAAAPTAAPTNLSPDGSTVGANPALSWDAVAGAVKYRVQVSTSYDFASLLYNQDTYNLKATPTSELTFTSLYWRVAGMDASNNLGPYAVATFTKALDAAPDPVTPSDGQVLTFPTEPVILTWQPVAGAASYNVRIANAFDMINGTTWSTRNTSYTLGDTQAFTLSDGVTPQSWYWTVQAVFSNAVSPWSSPRAYQISWQVQPTLQSPANLASGVTDVVFSWDPVPGAQQYQIQVSPADDFQTKSIDQTIFSTRYSPTTVLDNDSYYWRVRAKATGGTSNWGPWSQTWEFTREWNTRPYITYPRWSGTGDPPVISNLELRWTPAAASGTGWVDHAGYYEVEINTDINFSINSIICFTNHTVWTPYQSITGGGEPGGCNSSPSLAPGVYYWRVRAKDGNILGLWDMTSAADTQAFTYTPTMPDTSCTTVVNGTPVLCWSPVSGADRYVVTILKSNGTSVDTATTYATTYTPNVVLSPADGPFRWHVETIDGQGHIGVQRGVFDTFSLTTPTTDTSLSLMTPSSGWAGVRMPSMTWQPYTGAAYYKVRYGQTAGTWFVTPLSAGVELPFAGFTYEGVPLAGGHYYWAVEAYDILDGYLATSAAREFDLGQNLPTYGSWIVPWQSYDTPECSGVLQTDPSDERCVPVVGDTQTLRWEADGNAAAYVVYVAKDENFTNIYRAYLTGGTSLIPRESWLDSQAGQSYYWFVRPCANWDRTRCGPGPDTVFGVNHASAYRKESAVLTGLSTTTPANPPTTASTIANQVTFNWGDYMTDTQNMTYPVPDRDSDRPTQEAKHYLFQASTTADFSAQLEGSGITVEQTSYTPATKTYPEGPIYWRVQAVDGSGNPLTMSATGLVTKQSPAVTLTSPANGSTVTGLPFFTWNPENWAASYNIEVYKNGDTNWTSGNRVFNASPKVAAWSPTSSMEAGTYAWRVQRVDAQSRLGAWSTGRTFTLLPAAPALITPADGAHISLSTPLDFSWTVVQHGYTYKFQSSRVSDFATTVDNITTVMQEWAPTSNAYTTGVYYWRVSVLDSSGHTLNTSSSRTFTITAAPSDGSSTYRAITPRRVLDSRPTGSGHTNMGLTGKFTAGTVRTFGVAGALYVGGGSALAIPANAVAVTGNLTVTGGTAAGLIALGPTMSATGDTTTLNFSMVTTSSENRANNVTMGLSPTGTLSAVFRSSTGGATVDLIFDVTGYFLPDTAGATYHALSPGRVLDTRSGAGHIGLSGKFTNKTVRTISVSGVKALGWASALVPSNATAVTGNLTVTNATSDGFLAIGPTMTSSPSTSTLNTRKSRNTANGVTVALSGGKLRAVWVGTTGSSADVILDITGYFTADATGLKFYPIAPYRVLDSATNVGLTGAFATGTARTLPVGGTGGAGGVPANALGIAGNFTVIGPSSNGFAFIAPTISGTPSSSTVNANAGFAVANGFDVSLSGGHVDLIWVGNTVGSTAHLQLDINGYWK